MFPLAFLKFEASTDFAPFVAPVLVPPEELLPLSLLPHAATTSAQAIASSANMLGRTLMSPLPPGTRSKPVRDHTTTGRTINSSPTPAGSASRHPSRTRRFGGVVSGIAAAAAAGRARRWPPDDDRRRTPDTGTRPLRGRARGHRRIPRARRQRPRGDGMRVHGGAGALLATLIAALAIGAPAAWAVNRSFAPDSPRPALTKERFYFV